MRLQKILILGICLLVFLTGCVRYDVGVNFHGTHNGAIVQHIKLGEQLANFNAQEAQKWLTSIENRTKSLKGKIERISEQEITVTIPFNNGQELVTKFNQFFNPSSVGSSVKSHALDLVQLKSEISLQQGNLLLLERDRLSLSVDLRALGVLSQQGNIIVSPGSLIDLEFVLNTPWGARSIVSNNSLTPISKPNQGQLVWQLQPGQLNTIEAVFWMPSAIGLGTVLIVILVLGGFYLKYQCFPWNYQDSSFEQPNFT